MPAAWCRPIGRYRRTGALLKVLVGQSIRSIRHTLARLGNASTLAGLTTKLPLLMRRTSKRVAGLFILRMYGMRVKSRSQRLLNDCGASVPRIASPRRLELFRQIID